MTNLAGDRRHYPPPPPSPLATDRHYMGPSSSSTAASLKGCCCSLFLLLIFLTLLAIAIALIIIFAVRPKKPEFDLQRVGVEYLLVAPTEGISPPPAYPAAYLSLNTTLLFTAVNPNKVGIKYGAADLYVLYRGVPLGIAVVPGFEQPEHSTRLVESRVSVSRFNVLQADAVDLVRDASVNDRVELRVTGDVGAKIRLLGFTTPRVQVSVDCVIVISPRRQSLSYKQCGVDGLNL
ncbi:uncharacterized protein LOC110027595 isoform X2 [Phalaenopsis equestris]|uniref:uncharacterized protein LOC110027595 isoform X2 n=1 Tax=Phalaenopsis equestris TaxID=78828 RepID=UPI0009E5D257|nr:uncharacterized protein LOC110027595 isoform X2 [Phalaenopsis equestris]